jgi:hypothetical protein
MHGLVLQRRGEINDGGQAMCDERLSLRSREKYVLTQKVRHAEYVVYR